MKDKKRNAINCRKSNEEKTPKKKNYNLKRYFDYVF